MKDRSAWVLAALFTGAGIGHFVRPDFYEALIPDWLPNPELAVAASGVAEIGLGLAMVPRHSRRYAAIGLLGLLLVVYPANIDAAINGVDLRTDANGEYQRYVGEVPDARHWIRLPLQFLLLAWVWSHVRRPAPQAEDA